MNDSPQSTRRSLSEIWQREIAMTAMVSQGLKRSVSDSYPLAEKSAGSGFRKSAL
jgi:hypothetical protein